jgi:hypothetical protein
LTRSSACSQLARRTDTLPSCSASWDCGRIGEYESTLLQTIGFLQHNQLAAAEIALLEWCPPTAIRLALEAGQTFATALESHDLLIPIREHQTVRSRTPTFPTSAGSTLLH